MAFQVQIESEFKVAGGEVVNVYEAPQHLFTVVLIKGEQRNVKYW